MTQGLSDIIGQETIVARLKAFGEYYTSKDMPPEPILLIGREGMGKRTIARAFAIDYGRPEPYRAPPSPREVDSENLIRGDLTANVTNLVDYQFLLISNIQNLKKQLAEDIAQAVRSREYSVVIGTGSAERRHVIKLRPFTLFCTLNKKSDCPQALKDSFSLALSLEEYSQLDLQKVAFNFAQRVGVTLDVSVAAILAGNGGSCPKQIESLSERLIRSIHKKSIMEDDARAALTVMGIRVHSNEQRTWESDLKTLSGEDFERIVLTLLGRMGFQAELTKASGDGGIDVIATLNKPIVGGRYLFQCKRYHDENWVGAPTVRDFYGAVTADRAVKGILITTSNFTAQAREFAEKVGVELIAYDQLKQLLVEYGVFPASSLG
jgi:Holliday junction resolvasome RuvABC ATP-dependent DNA helicase subunit